MLEGLQWWLWKIILQLFWLAVLWISVMTALKSSEITWKVIEPIAAFGKSVWSLIQKAPQFAPIIPTWKWMMNASSLKNFWETTVWTINSKMAKPGSELSNKYFWEWTKMQEALRNLDLNKVTAATDDKWRLGKHYLPVLDALNDKDLLRPDFDKAVSSLETWWFLKEENAKQLWKLYNDRKNWDFAKQLYNLLEKKPLSKVDVTSPDMLWNKIWWEQPTVDSKKEDQKWVQNAVFNVILPTTKITKLSKGNLLTWKWTAEYDALYGAIKDEELGKVTKVEFTTSMMKQLDEDDNYNELWQTDREQLVKQVVEQIIDEKRTFKK